jgi:hypothetical protein
MFTPKDINGILMRPSGQPLASLYVEQREMFKGVRTETIDWMEKLSKVLPEDHSSDTIPSRTTVDEFLVYIATFTYMQHQAARRKCKTDPSAVPELEQKAVQGLKCPAKDSHTSQSYDWSI